MKEERIRERFMLIVIRGMLLSIIFLFPYSTLAAIYINEIAWMGTVDSANDEWIELYNDSEAESVEGWTLSDGAAISIVLEGELPPGYSVLERTDENTLPGIEFQIYTGALANGGATLTIKRPDGSVVDQVSGGENWDNIGGDNATKETAQYSSSGWITGAPTPGAANVTSGTVKPEEDDSDDGKDVSKSGGSKEKTSPSETVNLETKERELNLAIDAQKVAYVNQEITFAANPSGLLPKVERHLRFHWNFGDFTESYGEEVSHYYSYPGEYVVTSYAWFGSHEKVARHEVTVLPVTFSINRNQDKDILLHNNAKYEVDLSGYVLSGSKTFTFPDRSIMLPSATIIISKEKLGAESAMQHVALFDDRKSKVATTENKSQSSPDQRANLSTEPLSAQPANFVGSIDQVYEDFSVTTNLALVSEVDSPEEDYVETLVTVSESELSIIASSSDLFLSAPIPDRVVIPADKREDRNDFTIYLYLGLIAIISISIILIFIRPKDR